jgi:salicylate hydroxylase
LIGPDVINIGGGIAGLACALALQQRGARVMVCEQAARFEEVGAGLTLSQPANRGLFALGLRESIEAAADRPQSARVANYLTGEALDIPDRVKEAEGQKDVAYFYQIHRADMHAILVNAVSTNDPAAIRLGASFSGLEQDAEGVTAHFADGSSLRAPLLVGADGINSAVRTALFGVGTARFTGQVAYRFLVPRVDVEAFMTLGPSVHYVGPGQNLLRYVLRRGILVNGVGFVRTDNWTGEGWSTPAEPGELQAMFAGWHADVVGLIARAPQHATRKWALFDRDPLPDWTLGRATLMGDAAHPMLPFLGLGAAMGIEDAVVFARAWAANGDKTQSLAVYEASRRDRANAVLLASRRQADVHQSKNHADATRYQTDNRTLMAYDPASVALSVP